MASIADGQRKLEEEADAAAAAGDYARALNLLEQAAEEQAHSPELWMKLTAMRRTTGDMKGALKAAEHQKSVEARLGAAIPEGLGPRERGRVERFVSNASRRTRHFHQEPTDFHYPGLPEIEFHDRALFQLDSIEAQTAVIRAEFEALIAA